ncbi:hypothetical protein BDN72DRAFT_724923, partial [Pluteus cervinus]
MELGSPMICMYLLDQPDHYTNCEFTPFFWQRYVDQVKKAWETNSNEDAPEKLMMFNSDGEIVGVSPVYDYIFRPAELDDISLYDFIANCKRQ